MLDFLRTLFVAALVCHEEDDAERLVYEWNEEIKRLQKIYDGLTQKRPNLVDVVRCRDCYACEKVSYCKGGQKRVCRLFDRQMQEDDFCSYGERREKA